MREIVDVFGRAGEVNELRDPRHLRHRREPLLQPVFDGFDVVIGLALDVLDARRIGRCEGLCRCVERRTRRGGKWRYFDDRRFFGERDEP